MARLRVLVPVLVALAALAPAQAVAAHRKANTRPVGSRPLSDRAAAKLVRRSAWEPRPGNSAANHRIPTRAEIAYFHAHSDMPYQRRVTGNFRGTTDEIIQWAAYKHGINVNVLRAVAVKESWWRMDTIGDNGDSFGIFQVRRPYHCCIPLAGESTAFNADYYGAIIRAYYDGRMPWLNTVERGRTYSAGDLWGSVGAWFSGRWWTAPTTVYIAEVRRILHERTWRTRNFRA